MADSTVKTVLSICATVGSRLSDLVIKDGQLIFVRDKHKIAFDFGGKRTFYNQIEEVATEDERKSLTPENGVYYFVIGSAVLWTYQDKWIQMTTPPGEIVFIGTELPELGSNNTLYVNKNGGISVWDDDQSKYVIVADKNSYASTNDIDSMFSY